MKQIGVNQYVGEHPGIIEGCLDYLAICEGTRKKQEEAFKRKTPVQRFFHLADDELIKPLWHGVSTQHDFWRIGDNTLVELCENKYLPDVQESSKFIVHLHTLHVVDTARGNGVGLASMKKLMDIAERAGCIITLCARSFGVAPAGEELPYAVQSFEEMWERTSVDMWETVELPHFESDAVKFFYQRCGFQRICGCTEEDEPDDPRSNYFAYVPDSVEPEHKARVSQRLNIELCEFCS